MPVIRSSSSTISGGKVRGNESASSPSIPRLPPPQRSIWQLAADWLGNEAARLVEGDAPDETIRYRLTVCTGFDEHGKPVGARCPKCVRGKDGADYCGSCGCAEWKRARLTPEGGDLSTSKLAFPALVCPLGRFKAVRGRRKAAVDGK